MKDFFLCIRRILLLGHPPARLVDMQCSIQKAIPGALIGGSLEAPSSKDQDMQISEEPGQRE